DQWSVWLGCSRGRMIALDLSLENVYRQYHACRRNKRNTHNALRFEVDQEKHLVELREALVNHSYRPGRSCCSGPLVR
ncbi:MAG: hypothetical protein P8Z77_15005, partial [Candidatus Thiodiazotropha sp.]